MPKLKKASSHSNKGMAVIATDPKIARSLPKFAGLRTFNAPSEAVIKNFSKIFVAVDLLDLPSIAEFARLANSKHLLKALLVYDQQGSALLPQILEKANLRILRNMIVHSNPNLPSRILKAYKLGEQENLIANIEVIGNQILAINCAGEILEASVSEIPALKHISRDKLGEFTISDDGSFAHWPSEDIHLNLESIRLALDPQLREKKKVERISSYKLFGQAIAILREQRGLRQADVPGLSERQVRRLEKEGARPSISALRQLAHAHEMNNNEYLSELANISKSLGETLNLTNQGIGRKTSGK